MNLLLLIHPSIAITVVVLVVTAYFLKTGRRMYFVLHYVVGALAFVLIIVAFPIGLYYVAESGGLSVFPSALILHTANFVVAIGVILIQGGLGFGMLLFGRKRGWYKTHRRTAKYAVVVFLVQGTLGLAVLYGIIPFVFGP
jgi:hypothetical protein